VPWDIAVGNDLRHPQVKGPRPAKAKFINWYIGKLHMAARHGLLATAFPEVANFKARPERLLHPCRGGARDPGQSRSPRARAGRMRWKRARGRDWVALSSLPPRATWPPKRVGGSEWWGRVGELGSAFARPQV
jgi:hypothetical protein